MFSILKLAIIIIILNKLYCNANKLEIKNLHKDPILLVKLNDCKLQIGNIKIIHPINLTSLENTLESINKFVNGKVNNNLELYSIIDQKYKKLRNNFQQIKPPKPTRYKRWDALGSAWKWVAGNPDAQDLRLINTTINTLINENNAQFRLNEQINERIQSITNTVNKVVTQSNMVNRVLMTEVDMVTTIINIDTVNSILEDIQDAIVRTKVELTSNKVLSLKEILSMKELLQDQGIKITLPDEVLQYTTPKIAINNETLLYILNIPKLEEEMATTIMIVPLVVNDTVIKEAPKHLVRTGDRLFTSTDYKNFVQRYSGIKEFEDTCVKPLILGSKANCDVIPEERTTVQFIMEDKILINNAKRETLISDCGPDNRNLTGNFLIKFKNCTITINNRKFQSYETTSDYNEIQGALHNLQITRRLDESRDIALINQESIENRKQLKNVYLKQMDHQTWIWTLSSGVSFSSICIISLILYICCHKYRTTVKITADQKPASKEFGISYSELLEKAKNSTKNVDALPLPPGGVMYAQPDVPTIAIQTSAEKINTSGNPRRTVALVQQTYNST